MNLRTFARSTLGLLALSLAVGSCTSEASESDAAKSPGGNSGKKTALKFSAIPNEDATLLRAKYEPVAKYLTEKLGVTVEYVPAADYQASVAMFENDEIQLAWFGGFTGVQARHRVAGAHAIVKGALDARYKSYFIAPKGTSLKAGSEFLAGTKGKKFTFGSKSSTSGRLMPEFFIREKTGVAPDAHFAEVGFSGSHTNTIQQVAAGTFELGAVDFGVYDGMVKEGKLKKEDCPIIWESPAFADYQFTARPGLDASFGEGFTKKLTDALVAMDGKLANAFRRQEMVPASDADFAGIADVAKKLEMLR